MNNSNCRSVGRVDLSVSLFVCMWGRVGGHRRNWKPLNWARHLVFLWAIFLTDVTLYHQHASISINIRSFHHVQKIVVILRPSLSRSLSVALFAPIAAPLPGHRPHECVSYPEIIFDCRSNFSWHAISCMVTSQNPPCPPQRQHRPPS